MSFDRLRSSSENNPDWRIEDVYAACVSKSYSSWIPHGPPRRHRSTDEVSFRDSKIMLIWIAYDPVPGSLMTYADGLFRRYLWHSTQKWIFNASSWAMGSGTAVRIPTSMGDFDKEA